MPRRMLILRPLDLIRVRDGPGHGLGDCIGVAAVSCIGAAAAAGCIGAVAAAASCIGAAAAAASCIGAAAAAGCIGAAAASCIGAAAVASCIGLAAVASGRGLDPPKPPLGRTNGLLGLAPRLYVVRSRVL
ncbi:unnamed protein product [Fusarium equiseti]|uniref:Uncharacterized protein n=1 Tax=Fusarium equiseti TaxID=61235 RepID=A0A8J2IFQ6_FUSEQ|nr:unnamed protein product [Fusarium equiseti]